MGDTEVQHQRHRTRLIREVTRDLDVPTETGYNFFYVVKWQHSSFLLRLQKKLSLNVGVMKDYKLELRNLHASHALGWSRNWNT